VFVCVANVVCVWCMLCVVYVVCVWCVFVWCVCVCGGGGGVRVRATLGTRPRTRAPREHDEIGEPLAGQ
jgi:hypothetical protein